MLMIVGLNIFRFCMRAKLRARQKCNTNSSPECSHRQKRHRASLRRALFLLSPMFLHAIVPSPKMDSEDLFSLVFQFQAIHFFPNLFTIDSFCASQSCVGVTKSDQREDRAMSWWGGTQRSVGIGVWNPGTQRSVSPGDLHYRFSSVELYSKYTKPHHIEPWMLFCSPNEIIW